MKISILGNVLFGKCSGIGHYTKHLIEAIAKIDKQNTYCVLVFGFYHKKNKRSIKNLQYKFIKLFSQKIYNGLLRLLIAPPLELLAWIKSDLFIFPHFIIFPSLFTKKKFVFIYDLSFLKNEHFCETKNKKFLKRFVPKSINSATKIITISNFIKNEIINVYNTTAEKIEIIYPGVDRSFFYPRSVNEITNTLNKFGIKKSYLLYVGNIEPRKNINGLINAYLSLPESIKNQYQLVLVGGKEWKDKEIEERLINLNNQVLVLGYLPNEDLPFLYSGASLFIYPSFYEGFGIPPLEAMACGAPVITSNNSALPEVVGDAAHIVNPNDNDELRQSIEKLITNPTLRKNLKEKGLEQSKKFSWDLSAQRFIELIEKS